MSDPNLDNEKKELQKQLKEVAQQKKQLEIELEKVQVAAKDVADAGAEISEKRKQLEIDQQVFADTVATKQLVKKEKKPLTPAEQKLDDDVKGARRQNDQRILDEKNNEGAAGENKGNSTQSQAQ